MADRLSDEVDWLRQCAGWLTQLDTGRYPPAVNLRPATDWPETCHRAVDLARVLAVLERIAADVDEFARARHIEDLDGAAVPMRGPNVAVGWPSRTWISVPSATRARCRPAPHRNWNVLGKPGKPNTTGAVRPLSHRTSATTRSGPAEHTSWSVRAAATTRQAPGLT
ncbi:hypothetical protein [Actinopolyspora erythraea]|uniref:hypothetical protein n=1 Tax=Actinopolyspora erythraea TaxID=414996 RepID=UPI0011847580|nr:hypothetical protein [Actinopolyspora erythraea]